MPYYGRCVLDADLLARTVNGVINQTWTNWVLYLVDDGSKDFRACDVLKSVKGLDRMYLVMKTNQGVSSARNFALDMIRYCDYVAFCDGDDVWYPNYLRSQLNTMNSPDEKDTLPDLVYMDPEFKFVDGSVAIPYGIAQYPEFPGTAKLLESNFIYISGVVTSIEVARKHYFDGSLNGIEDWDYWAQIAKSGYKIVKNQAGKQLTYTCKPYGNGAVGNQELYDRFRLKNINSRNAIS